jgi:glycosyltransferase involved in cell wall biosynthesis
MRVLLIGHTYVTAENQKKLWALAEEPGVELTLIAPPRWRDDLGELALHRPASAPFEVRAVPAVWLGHEQFYWYRSLGLDLRRLRPDVLCVEQGAGSLVYAQSLLYRNRYAPRAKAVFFTWWNRPYRARWPLRAVERFNLRHSQGGIAGNAEAARILRDHGYEGPLLILPQLGVDPVAFAPRDASATRRQLGLDRFTVGYVGRLVEDKGLRVLLDALDGAPFDYQLLLVGRGPMEGDIRSLAAARGWGQRLTLVPDAGHGDVPRYLNCMDVLVLPSLARIYEQFGHVLVEAMACEVPVVGSTSGEIPNVIGDAGLVVPEGDVAALRDALARLAGDAELRRRLAGAGRERVAGRYTHAHLAARLVEFFRAL